MRLPRIAPCVSTTASSTVSIAWSSRNWSIGGMDPPPAGPQDGEDLGGPRRQVGEIALPRGAASVTEVDAAEATGSLGPVRGAIAALDAMRFAGLLQHV